MVKELKTALIAVAAFAFFSFAIAFGINNPTGFATAAQVGTHNTMGGAGAMPAPAPWCQHYDLDGDGYERVMCHGREARGQLTDCMDCSTDECAKVNPNGGVCISDTTMLTCAGGHVHVRQCPGGCVPSGTAGTDFCYPAPVHPQPVQPRVQQGRVLNPSYY